MFNKKKSFFLLKKFFFIIKKTRYRALNSQNRRCFFYLKDAHLFGLRKFTLESIDSMAPVHIFYVLSLFDTKYYAN